MTSLRQCPQCRAELPADAPDGVCPKCLMQLGFESRDVAPDRDRTIDRTASRSGFIAPSPEELARHFPQFEIVELLGKGGMGAVYKARQPKLDRYVALKILPSEVGKDPAFAERFMREARALAMLNHSRIVAVHDFGEADGLYYFVMEYVDGANLRQTIESGGLTPPEALAIVPQICDALQFAHDEGVVHRDIKPENILIDKRGRVKIADFGLAKLLGIDAEDSAVEKPFTLTGTHQVMGTPRYMAPEQMQGSSAVDHRADIYSLGVVFYEMLTGELPIGRFELPSKKVRIDVRLDDVVLRSLESAPERRYQHASNLKTEVESIVGASDTRLAPAKPDTVDSESCVRARLKVPAIALMVSGVMNLLAALSVVVILALVAESVGPGIEASWRKILSMATVVIAIASLVLGIILLIGAARMFDLQSYRIALFAAVIAILPCSLAFPISLPFGIWALIVLSRRDVRTAFADWHAESQGEKTKKESESAVGATKQVGVEVESNPSADEVRLPITQPDTADFEVSVRGRLKVPAIGMLGAGVVNLLATLVILLIPVMLKRSGSFADGLEGFVEGKATFDEAIFLSVILASFSLASGIILLLGAARMFDLQSYPITVFAAIVAIVPCAVGFPISLPCGIWALLVLSRRDVRTAFADWHAESQGERPKKGSESALVLTIVYGMIGGLALGAALDPDRIGVYMILGMVFGILLGSAIDMMNRRETKQRG